MFKKYSIWFATFILIFATQMTAQEETSSFEPFTGKVIGSKVRIRTQPNLEAHVVRETAPGELFGVVGEDNDYYAVMAPKGTKGYVFRTFILDGVVEGERVNVRLYPDIEAPVIGKLNTGDHVSASVSDINSKWLEVDLPESSHFYIAKEYVESKGPISLIATLEKRHKEATHHLSSAFLYAQSEIQKPFEQIDLDKVNEKFDNLIKEYEDIPDIAHRAYETNAVIQDIYVQKKIAFLESKADRGSRGHHIEAEHLDRLAKLGFEIQPQVEEKDVVEIAEAASDTIGYSTPLADEEITDKMLGWQPFEESLYHLWAAANGESTIQEFYAEQEENSITLSGILEPYNRPVKNRPGDFLLRSDHLPVAFLYSTKVNLEKLVGKSVTLIASPRPNHNFAFPAYFVLAIE